jgi:splicing factor 3B subunit 3
VIRQGLKVREIKSIRYHQPQDIWSIKNAQKDEVDRMIIISLPAKTLILTNTANGFSQTKDTGLDEESPTLFVGRLDDDSLVQVLPSGFRHIRKDKTARTMRFEGRIMKGTTRGRQMVLALAGGDIIYYELDQTGALSEVTQASLDAEVVAFDFSPVEKGRVRSSFLAVALSDFTTRIFELSADSCLRPLSTQNMRTAI